MMAATQKGTMPVENDEGALQQQPQPRKQRRRTIDVTTGAASFDELLLPGWLLRGLAVGGFTRCIST